MKPLRLLPAPAFIFSIVLVASSALAHPGHPFAAHGPTHIVTSPYHLAMLAAAGLALWLSARFVGNKLPRLSMQTLGVLSMLAAGVLWGWRA